VLPSKQLAHVKIKRITVLNLQTEMAKTAQCWPHRLQLSVEIQCQSLLSKRLEAIALWCVPDNFSNTSSGQKDEEQVGAPIVIFSFSLGASTA